MGLYTVKNKLTQQSGHDGKIYEPKDLAAFCSELFAAHTERDAKQTISSDTIAIPASFDIETSSFYCEGKKAACMYVWQFGIAERVMIGRTWEEWVEVIRQLNDYLHSVGRNLIIWVHNLAYEFQWMRHWLNFEKIFAVGRREPVYAWCGKICFRCSYKESGLSLKYIGAEKLIDTRYKKMVGDLDYRKIRHTKTPLTDEEIGYCMGDVLVLNQYIKEK